MRKDEFLSRLRSCLSTLPSAERESTLEFYDEQISDRIDDGMSEQDAIASLEAPEEIAANVLIAFNQTVEHNSTCNDPEKSCGSGSKFSKGYIIPIIITAVFLSPIIAILILITGSLWMGIFFSIASVAAVALASFFGSVAFTAGGIALISAPGGAGISMLGIGIFILGATILLILMSYYLMKHFLILSKKFIWYCKDCVTKNSKPKKPKQQPQSPYAEKESKNYEALPLPDFSKSSEQPNKKVKAHPVLYSVYLSLILLFTGAIFAIVPVLKAGGPYELAKISGYEYNGVNQSFDTQGIASFDLSSLDVLGPFSTLKIKTSPDDQIHIYSNVINEKRLDFTRNKDVISASIKDYEKLFSFTNIYHMYAYEHDQRLLNNKYDVNLELPTSWSGELVLPRSYVFIEDLNTAASFKSHSTLNRIHIKNSTIGGKLNVMSENISMIDSKVDGAVTITGLLDNWSVQLYNSSAKSFDLSGNGNVSFADINAESLKIALFSGSVYGTLPGALTDYSLNAQASCASNHLLSLDNPSSETQDPVDDSEIKNYLLPPHSKVQLQHNRRWSNIHEALTTLNTERRLSFDRKLGPSKSEYLRFQYTAQENKDYREGQIANEDSQIINYINAGLDTKSSSKLSKFFKISTGDDLKEAKLHVSTENGLVQLGFLGDDEVWGYNKSIKGASILHKAIVAGYRNTAHSYNFVSIPYIINLDKNFEVAHD